MGKRHCKAIQRHDLKRKMTSSHNTDKRAIAIVSKITYILDLDLIILFMYMYVLPACMSLQHILPVCAAAHASLVDPLELG